MAEEDFATVANGGGICRQQTAYSAAGLGPGSRKGHLTFAYECAQYLYAIASKEENKENISSLLYSSFRGSSFHSKPLDSISLTYCI